MNHHGSLLPVYDVRELLGLDKMEIRIDDFFLICEFEKQIFGLLVEGIGEVIQLESTDYTSWKALSDQNGHVGGIYCTEKGLLYVFDLSALLNMSLDLEENEPQQCSSEEK